jgi:histidine decarboxylase
MNSNLVLQEAIGPFDVYCYGFGNPGATGKGYILGFVLSSVKKKKILSHQGSQTLDKINAFDLAEVKETNIGQINLIQVSSFCGPTGLIWGYHLVKPRNLYQSHPLGIKSTSLHPKIKVYSAGPLFEASKTLLGTVEKPHFPIIPGSHLPSAYKTIEQEGPSHLFASIAIGIAKNRERHANLLMEDVGQIPLSEDTFLKQKLYKKQILQKLADSVVIIGQNQKVEYKEIFVAISDVIVKKGEIGCALIAAPYITLAKKAYHLKTQRSLSEINIDTWRQLVKPYFLCYNK